jgi:phage tail protein X
VNLTSGNLGVELELQTLLGEELLGLLSNLSVHAGATNLTEELDNGDFRAETRPDGGLQVVNAMHRLRLQDAYHLETNDTTTDNDHLLGHLLERDRASAGDDLLLVDSQARERCGLRTGGNEDVLSANGGLATLNQVDRNGVFVLESAGSLDVFHVVLLEQKLDTLCQTRHGCLLRLHHSREVEFDIADFNTAALGVVEDLVVEVRVVEEGFRGNAADVQAGSAEGATLLDAGNL